MSDYRRAQDIPARITAITTYRCSDGEVFDTLADAIEHQDDLNAQEEVATFLAERPGAANKPPAKLLADLVAWQRGRG